jgi:xanthine dehydrogenase accessory factor
VLVSRGHKQDELSLREVVRSNAAYVGMIGSLRRVGTVLTHLAREGFPREALERVYTPIGLDIGAETPEEIAVSIVAELVMVRRGGSGAKLSELRRAKIRE